MIAPNTTLPSASLAFVVLVRIALPPFSVVGDSAVGMNGLAGDKPAVVGDQEQGSGGDLLRHPLAREVSILPGQTTLTRMLWAANSEAKLRANPTRPILAAETWARPEPPENAPSPVKNRIRP